MFWGQRNLCAALWQSEYDLFLNKNFMKKNVFKRGLMAVISVAFSSDLMFAQSSTSSRTAALTGATNEVKSYFAVACDLFYVVCAIMALVGAFKVYSKWSSGDPDTTKTAGSWIGSLVFAVVVITLIKSFFNV